MMHCIKILADTDKPMIIVMLWQITEKNKLHNYIVYTFV